MTRTAAAAGSDSPGAPGGGGGGNEGDTFVVQRGRTVPTLSSVSSATDKEHLNQDTKSEERGEEGQEDYGPRRRSVFDQMKNIPTAGISSDSPRRPSLRRNSVSSENNQSQIDLGGSQVGSALYDLSEIADVRVSVLFAAHDGCRF